MTRQPLNSTTPYNETPTELLYGEEINFNTILGQAEQAIQTERANIRVVTTRRTKDLDKNKTDSKSGQPEQPKKMAVKKRKSPENIAYEITQHVERNINEDNRIKFDYLECATSTEECQRSFKENIISESTK